MRRHVRWLYDQLPGLVAEGVLTPDAAARLRARYGPVDDAGAARAVGRIAFAVLGTTLVGAGVILLVAHNWDALGRDARAAISLGLLVVAQALAGGVIALRPGSVAWREASGSALVLAVGASLALVSQTFHLQGEASDFLWTWIALALPVPYVVRARFPTVLLLIGLAAWTAMSSDHDRAWSLVGLAAVAPTLAAVARKPTPTARDALVGWFAMLALVAVVVRFSDLPTLWMLPSAGLLGALAASASFVRGPAWRGPARTVGVLGTGGLAVTLTVADVWRGFGGWGPTPGLVLAAALGLASLAGAGVLLARGRLVEALAPLFPAVALAARGVAWGAGRLPAAIFVDVVAGIAALVAVGLGLRDARLARTNVGLVLLSALLVVRFLDPEVSTVVRGLAFIGIGVAFLAANARLLAARREVA